MNVKLTEMLGKGDAFIVGKYRIRKRKMRWHLAGKLRKLVFCWFADPSDLVQNVRCPPQTTQMRLERLQNGITGGASCWIHRMGCHFLPTLTQRNDLTDFARPWAMVKMLPVQKDMLILTVWWINSGDICICTITRGDFFMTTVFLPAIIYATLRHTSSRVSKDLTL